MIEKIKIDVERGVGLEKICIIDPNQIVCTLEPNSFECGYFTTFPTMKCEHLAGKYCLYRKDLDKTGVRYK